MVSILESNPSVNSRQEKQKTSCGSCVFDSASELFLPMHVSHWMSHNSLDHIVRLRWCEATWKLAIVIDLWRLLLTFQSVRWHYGYASAGLPSFCFSRVLWYGRGLPFVFLKHISDPVDCKEQLENIAMAVLKKTAFFIQLTYIGDTISFPHMLRLFM